MSVKHSLDKPNYSLKEYLINKLKLKNSQNLPIVTKKHGILRQNYS